MSHLPVPKTLDKTFKLIEGQIDNLVKKAKEAPLLQDDLVRLETLIRVYSIANNSLPKNPGRPPSDKVKNLAHVSDNQLLQYAKGK